MKNVINRVQIPKAPKRRDNSNHAFYFNFTHRELGVNYAWIGYNDIRSEGSFEWYYPQQNKGYTNWCSGHPNGSPNSNEDCVYISLYSKCWYDRLCDSKWNFICGIPS